MKFTYQVVFAVISALSVCLTTQAAMVPSNILQRVFNVKIGTSSGTAFTIEVEGRQYLVTAKHVIAASPASTAIEVFRNNKWIKMPYRLINVEPKTVDIAVLAVDRKLSPLLPIQTGIKGAYLSQQVFFAGFPFGLSIDGRRLNSGFPLPLVKHGIISSFENNRGEPFIVDAISNPGFSGGPVVIAENRTNPTIIGVVSGYRFDEERVYYLGKEVKDLSVRPNTGLLIAFSIDYAIDAIKRNPIGFRVSAP